MRRTIYLNSCGHLEALDSVEPRLEFWDIPCYGCSGGGNPIVNEEHELAKLWEAQQE